MSTVWLFLILLLTWGPSWYAITFQIAEVSPEVSVGIRFLLAGVIFSAFCMWRGEFHKLSRKQWLHVLSLALLLFSIHYIILYHATHSLSSGLISVIFSTLPIFNIVNSRIFLGETSSGKTWAAAVIGLVGIAFVFHNEWQLFATLSGPAVMGVGLGFLATYIASLGNMMAMQNSRLGLSTKVATAYGMVLGGACTLVFAALAGHDIRLPLTAPFLGSLLFLTVMASIVGFYTYFRLLERVGPGRSAYVALVYPIVAIYISTLFEGYVVDDLVLVGFALIMVGNGLILSQKDRKAPSPEAVAKSPQSRHGLKLELEHELENKLEHEWEQHVWVPAHERLKDS